MKKKSKKRGGFSLVEVVLSMALIAILSIGVYNAYLILIRQTKDGQVKQGAALAGKKIVEEIKAGDFQKDDDGNLTLESINLIKNGEDYQMPSGETFSVDGYDYVISMEPKKINGTNSITIDNKDYTGTALIVGENSVSSENSNSSSEITGNKTIELKIDSGDTGTVGFSDSSNKKNINVNDNIILDFKYYSQDSNVEIQVENLSGKNLNLYIINTKYNDLGKRNVTVENKQGSLNEYYRYNNEGKSGTLYDVTVTVSGKNSKGQSVDNLFESSFVQNIDTN